MKSSSSDLQPLKMQDEHENERSLFLRDLAKTLHARLPPELREIIYENVLEEKTMRSLQRRSNNLGPGWARTKSSLPPFLNASIVGVEMPAEIITCFYKRCKGFHVPSPGLIKVLLLHDYFGHGITLSTIPIPALEVRIYARAERGRDLCCDFSPLLHADQKWAKCFCLNIILEKVVSERHHTVAADTVEDIWDTVVGLRPILEEVKRRGGDVNVRLEIEDSSTRGCWKQNVTGMMDGRYEVWERAVKGIVAELWKDVR